MRLDQLLVERGHFATREKARRAVMAGQVQVNGVRVDKPGSPMREDVQLELTGTPEPYVSRAGGKLAAALDHFAVDPAGRRCLDVGASTGGFSDCLLQRGAVHITALDVGYGLLRAENWSLTVSLGSMWPTGDPHAGLGSAHLMLAPRLDAQIAYGRIRAGLAAAARGALAWGEHGLHEH